MGSFGEMTPTRIASYGLTFAGLALLLAGRIVPALQGSWWIGIALLIIAIACFVDALLPGGSELTDEQIVILRHSGVPYRDGWIKIANLILGVALALGGAYLVS